MLYSSVALLLVASASGLQIHVAQQSSSIRTRAPATFLSAADPKMVAEGAAAEEEEEEGEPPLGLPILTLKERDDGWDDVVSLARATAFFRRLPSCTYMQRFLSHACLVATRHQRRKEGSREGMG